MVLRAAVWRFAAATCAVGAPIAGAGTAGAAPTPPPGEGRILGADRAGAVKGSYIVTFKDSVARGRRHAAALGPDLRVLTGPERP